MSYTSALNRPLPLRRSTVIDDYQASAPLGFVFGRVTAPLTRFSGDGLIWHVSDGDIQGVESVTVDGKPAGAWDWRNSTDDAGHKIALVEFNVAPEPGKSVAALVRGTPDPLDGALLTNPGDWLWYVLAEIMGQPLARSRTARFAAECARLGVEIHGFLADTQSTARTVISQVLAGIGAVFSPAMPELAHFYPAPRRTDEPIERLYALDRHPQATLSAAADRIVTAYRIEYAYDWAVGRPAKTTVWQSAEGARDFGYIEGAVNAAWVHSDAVIADVARRALSASSRQSWAITVNDELPRGERLLPGEWVRAESAEIGFAADAMVLGADEALDSGVVSVSFEIATGAVPTVDLVSQSVAADQDAGDVFASRDGDTVTLTIKMPDGKPIAGAEVVFDGETRVTNAQGQARFAKPPGVYSLVVRAPGFATINDPAYEV